MTNEKLNPKLNWDSFANELSLLTKYYKTADDDFINGMKQYCTDIRKGFARSRYYPEGYSLNNQWVIDSFNLTFEPLLTRLFPENSLGWVEFAFAKIQLPISHHLTKDSLCSIAEKLKLIEFSLESQARECNQINKQFIKEASSVGLIANILNFIHNYATKEILSWCECCWRRAHKTSNYCLLHKPKNTGSNNSNKMGRKIFKEISSEFTIETDLTRVRSIRMAFTNKVNIISYDDSISLSNSNLICIRTDDSTKILIESTINIDWSMGVSKLWDNVFEKEFPCIKAVFKSKPSSFSSWSEFINSVRENLNEVVEDCTHPYWFLFELSIAERWIRYENHSTNPKKIRDFVLAYSSDGLSVKEISNKVGLKKSQIYQIIKNN